MQTNDLSLALTYTLRYKVYLASYPTVLSNFDFNVVVTDPCLTTTISLDSGSVLKNTGPLVTQYVTYASVGLSWPKADVVSTHLPACGNLVFELWDVSSGVEVDPSTKSVVVADFTDPTTHSLSVQTNNFAYAATYTMRYKAYIDAYTQFEVL